MAGNPFRKSEVLSHDVATREAVPQLRIETSGPGPGKSKGKVQKKVRILSPVISPDTPGYREHDPFNSQHFPIEQPRSPAPAPAPEEKDLDVARELRKSFIDSVARGASNVDSMQPGVAAVQTHQAPYNPFSKTLATIEGQHVPNNNVDQSPVGLSKDSPDQKSAMDVDAFTRMLLTGNAGPSASPHGTSSASTPSGSHSFEEHHPESLPGSEEDDASDSGDEQSSLVDSGPDPPPKKEKPPPPVHHHGKPVSRKGPQTVSFADFSSSAEPSPALSVPSSPKPTISRSASDLNKPLPPPPPQQQTASPDASSSMPGDSPSLGNDAPQARRPPPPPTARRSSMMKSRPRSSSNLSKSSIAEDIVDDDSSLSQHSYFPSMKPPPPPTRRAPASANPSETPSEAEVQSPASRAPPPPPSRGAAKRNVSLSRTPSSQSVASLNQRRTSPSITPGPPPPPPRRGDAKRQSMEGAVLGPSGSRKPSDASHRSSLEMRRMSGTSFQSGGGRTPSISSIAEAPGPAITDVTPLTQTASGNDILADMSAFQREIDELVAKSGTGRKPSN